MKSFESERLGGDKSQTTGPNRWVPQMVDLQGKKKTTAVDGEDPPKILEFSY